MLLPLIFPSDSGFDSLVLAVSSLHRPVRLELSSLGADDVKNGLGNTDMQDRLGDSARYQRPVSATAGYCWEKRGRGRDERFGQLAQRHRGASNSGR